MTFFAFTPPVPKFTASVTLGRVLHYASCVLDICTLHDFASWLFFVFLTFVEEDASYARRTQPCIVASTGLPSKRKLVRRDRFVWKLG